MTTVIRITGKARHVFKLTSLFAIYRGEDTIGKIVDEDKSTPASLLCKGSEFNTSLAKS
jgi:hypothetical protein